MIIQTSISAFTALIWLLRIVTWLIKIIIVNEAWALIDDLATGANVDTSRKSITTWAHLSVSRLPLIDVISFELLLWHSLHHLIISSIQIAFLETCRPLVNFHLTLRLTRLLVQQIALASLWILIKMLLVTVDVLVWSANYDWLTHVRILIDLTTFIVASWTLTTNHHVVLSKLLWLLLVVWLLGSVHRIWVKVIVLLNHGLTRLLSLATTST